MFGSLSGLHFAVDAIFGSFWVFEVEEGFRDFDTKLTRTRILWVVGHISGSLMCFHLPFSVVDSLFGYFWAFMGHLGSLAWFPCDHCGLKVVFLGRSGGLWKSTDFYSNDSVLFG